MRFLGWPLLTRLAIRRDRILAPVSIAVLVLMSVASAAATPGLYPDEQTRIHAAEALNRSPAIVALYGPILDVTSVGELSMTKMTVLYAVFVAVLFIVIVRRHTRVEEESGRSELIGGTAVGRHAPLLASAAVVVAWAAVLGIATAAGNAISGLDLTGSIAFGGLWAGSALVAAGVGFVAAQLSASARTCAAFAAGTIAVFFVLRAVGDIGPEWLSWCSPLGWNTQVRAYGDQRWWLLALYPALALLLFLVASRLRSTRDLGSGLVAARPGPTVGREWFGSVLALTARIHATTLVLWSVASMGFGIVFGMIAPGVGDLFESGPAQDIVEQLGGALVAALLSVMAVVVAYFAVTVVVHSAHDETEGGAEMVLAAGTGRGRWFCAGLILSVLGTTWLMLLTGVGLWLGYAIADGPAIGNLVVAALAWTPAIWVVIALVQATIALGVRWAPLSWAWPAAFLTLTMVGDLLRFPAWITDLSPYAHVPLVPAETWSWGSAAGLTAVATLIAVLAWIRFRRRDIG